MMGGVPLGTQEVFGTFPSVLALHGFGATTQEVSMVIDVARALGLRAVAPLLPGHGVSVNDLAQTRYADWRGAAERALHGLIREGGSVIIVGSSMGSLLALDLAADHPRHVVGVAALAPAIRLSWPFPSLALAIVCGLGVADFTVRKAAPDIRDPEGRRTQVTYEAQPAYAGNEVRLAGRRVESRLHEIRCPAFVAHGRRDHVCPVSNARRVYAKLGTRSWDKELLILPQSFHIITRDVERGLLRSRLHHFIERLVMSERDRAARPHHVPVEPYPPAARLESDRVVQTST
jgi:carboxylesterase